MGSKPIPYSKLYFYALTNFFLSTSSTESWILFMLNLSAIVTWYSSYVQFMWKMDSARIKAQCFNVYWAFGWHLVEIDGRNDEVVLYGASLKSSQNICLRKKWNWDISNHFMTRVVWWCDTWNPREVLSSHLNLCNGSRRLQHFYSSVRMSNGNK